MPGSGGIYPLYRYAGCTDPHRGKWSGDSCFVVARGSPEERLFLRKQLNEADAYARQTKTEIESLPNGALCDAAIRELYSGV